MQLQALSRTVPEPWLISLCMTMTVKRDKGLLASDQSVCQPFGRGVGMITMDTMALVGLSVMCGVWFVLAMIWHE